MALHKLRAKVAECLEQHLYESAVFLADKLVTMSDGNEEDVYALAQAYCRAGSHKRAVHVISEAGLVDRHDKFRYLVAKCHVMAEEWEPALAVLGDNLKAAGQSGDEMDFRAPMSLLRGKIYDAMDDRPKAVEAYRRALQLDCCCYEAFKHLTQHHLLSAQDEQTLMSEISFGAEDKWLELLYRAKVSRYQTAAAGAKPPPSPATAAAELEPGEEAAPAQDMAIDGGSSGGGYTRAPPIVDLDELESGYNLRGNLDLLAQRAEVLYYGHHLRAAAESCRAILRRDPHSLSAMPTYLCALHELALKNELFYQAHQLVDHHPQEAVAWFAVGCYYHLVGSYDSARRYFEKATHLDNWFAPAWLGYGHAFAAQDESDQAMVAYRIAAKLFPGCHFCPLFVGMECARTHNLPLASRYFAQAMEICPIDPLTYHEVGVVHYQNHELGRARECFLRVLELTCGGGGSGDSRTGSSSERRLEPWLETTLFNLGHTCRKLKSYDEAIGYYGQALHAQPHKASTYAALGFTYHLKGEIHQAIDHYHQALGLKSEDTFATSMLQKAFEEMAHVPIRGI